MKKILFTLVMAAMAAVGVKAQTSARVFLSHNGNATIFNGAEVNEAIAAAVDGDTLYLSEGSFAGPFTVDKKVSFIGTGQSTILIGEFKVEIPDSVTLTSTLLQGVYLNGSIAVNKPVNNMIIRKVKVKKDVHLKSAMVSNGLLENCFIENLFTNNNMNHHMMVLGSWVRNVYNEAMHFSFVNCNVAHFVNAFQGECINCIVHDSNNAKVPATFANTLYCNSGGYSSDLTTYVNCWTISNTWSESSWFDISTGECKLTYQDKLGTDGTVIGYHGGPAPYTLEMYHPTVTDMETEVSNDAKTLNVNVTVKPHL